MIIATLLPTALATPAPGGPGPFYPPISIPSGGLFQVQYTGTPIISGSVQYTTIWVSSAGSTAASTPVELFMNASAAGVSGTGNSINETMWGGYTSPQNFTLNASSQYVVNVAWELNGSWGDSLSCPGSSMSTGISSYSIKIFANVALSSTIIPASNSTRIPVRGSLVSNPVPLFTTGGSLSTCNTFVTGSVGGKVFSNPYFFNITTTGVYYLEAYWSADLTSYESFMLPAPTNTVCINLQGSSTLSTTYCPAFTSPRPGATISRVQVL